MTFAAPLFAWIAAAVAAATVALHLLAWRRPPETPLPTARFAPDTPVRTVSRAIRLADLMLLLLRVALVLLVGGALAGPTFASRASGLARVVVIDRSRRSGAGAAVTDSARSAFRAGDAVVLFDSVAREVNNATSDSLSTAASSGDAGTLSAALIVAIRAARRLERERDSVEIVIVSPFATEETDAATGTIRRTWPGVVRAIRAGSPTPNDATAGRAVVRGPAGDAVAATLELAGDTPSGGSVRVIRDDLTAADSVWAREGHALVVWPSASLPRDWQARPRSDSTFAVTALAGEGGDAGIGDWPATVVAPFVRVAMPPAGRVIARWQDGEPAVTEVALGSGCVRAVAVAVSPAGDLALSPAFRRFAERMVGNCHGVRPWVAVSDSVLAAMLSPARGTIAVGQAALDGTANPPSKIAAWLLGVALLAALAELALRRGSTHATA